MTSNTHPQGQRNGVSYFCDTRKQIEKIEMLDKKKYNLCLATNARKENKQKMNTNN